MIVPKKNKNNTKFYLAISLLFLTELPLKTIGKTEISNPGTPLSSQNTHQQTTSLVKKNKCINEFYTVEELQKDIFLLMNQNQLSHPYTLGKFWREIPLEGLPIGHVNYLLTADQALSTDIDVSNCRSAPCVFNTIYNKPKDNIAGFTAFLLFLQTGYILSGIAKVPRMEIPKNIPLSSFYFKDEELIWLWLWMKNLPDQFFRLESFQYIYRFPHNMNMNSDPHTCGKSEALLYTEDAQGFMVLPDCAFKEMNLPFAQTDLSYTFTLFHEIGHHYDFSLSFQHPSAKMHSETEDFLKLSNWKKEKSHQGNTSIEQRKHYSDTKQYDGFLRDYSQESPSEDFADSLAAYRIYPDILKTISPMKFQYLKERVFNGRDYTHLGNKEYYTSKIFNLIQSQAPEWILTCLNAEDFFKEDLSTFTFSQIIHEKFLKNGFLVNNINCLEIKIHKEVKKLEMQLRRDEFEACSFLKNNESNWWYKIIHNHSDFFVSFLNNIDTKPIYNTEITEFRNQITRESL